MKFVSIMGLNLALNEVFENSSMVISMTHSYHF